MSGMLDIEMFAYIYQYFKSEHRYYQLRTNW